MYEWQQQIQIIVDEIDKCIKNYNDEACHSSYKNKRFRPLLFRIRRDWYDEIHR